MAVRGADLTVDADGTKLVRLGDGRSELIAARLPRFGAALIDGVVAGGLSIAIEAAVRLRVLPHAQLSAVDLLKRWAISLPITLVVIVAVMVATNGRTPGKALLGLQVVPVSGARISARFALWREIGIKWVLFGWPSLLPGAWRLISIVSLVDVAPVLWDSNGERFTTGWPGPA